MDSQKRSYKNNLLRGDEFTDELRVLSVHGADPPVIHKSFSTR